MLELVRPAKIDAVCAGLVFMMAIVLVSESQTARSAHSDNELGLPTGNGYREGAVIERILGQFEQQGGRIVFVAQGGERFTALENLNLQRVAEKLQLEAGTLSWSISGHVTEYSGARYLLISRAQARRASPSEARRSPSSAASVR